MAARGYGGGAVHADHAHVPERERPGCRGERALRAADGGRSDPSRSPPTCCRARIVAGGAHDRLFFLGRVPHPCHVEVVDLDKDGRLDLLVSDLGAPAPGDELRGSVQWLRAKADKTYAVVPLATALPRVADAQAGDFDGDGDLDVVVAAFGWRKVGGILLLENRTTDWAKPSFVPRTLDERTGAIHVPVTDLDGDGRLDFVALLSQHHETVVAFLGDGKGGFRQQTIDAAPHPAWGSSGIQLVDLDGDKDQDVLVSNGDMLDDYQLKPYHGIRWLENRGGFPFVAHDVAPMFGVIRAQAADLDGDKDMDIVAGSLVQVGSPSGSDEVAGRAVARVARADRARRLRAPHARARRAAPQPRPRRRRRRRARRHRHGELAVGRERRRRGLAEPRRGALTMRDQRLLGSWKSDRRDAGRSCSGS